MANKWVEFVRKWSRDHGVSYMCASTMPACKEEYKTGKAPKNTKKANIEQMGMEDKDVALPKKAKKGITADTLKDKISQIKEAKKMGVEDIKSAMLRRAVGIVQPLQSADTAVVKPKGRPKKYATAEEARRMKSVKTVEARKAKKAKEAMGAGYDSNMSEVSDDEIISRINKKGKVVRLNTNREIMEGGVGSYDAEHGREMVDNYSMIINHLVEHISDPSEPVDPRDYDQAIHFIREMRRAKGGAEYYGGAVNSGNEFLDVIANTGHQLGQSHPASKFGLNPFDLGMKFGEKVVAPALMKTKLGNPHTGIFSKHFWSPKKRHGGAINSGNEFLDVIANTGHQMGQSHPASKFGLNPFDMGENLGEKLGNAMMKTKLGNPKTGIFSKKFWTPKKHH